MYRYHFPIFHCWFSSLSIVELIGFSHGFLIVDHRWYSRSDSLHRRFSHLSTIAIFSSLNFRVFLYVSYMSFILSLVWNSVRFQNKFHIDFRLLLYVSFIFGFVSFTFADWFCSLIHLFYCALSHPSFSRVSHRRFSILEFPSLIFGFFIIEFSDVLIVDLDEFSALIFTCIWLIFLLFVFFFCCEHPAALVLNLAEIFLLFVRSSVLFVRLRHRFSRDFQSLCLPRIIRRRIRLNSRFKIKNS